MAPLQSSIRFYGLGLGPGDPDYMSVRALKVLQSADRLVHFSKKGKRGNARTIADAVVSPDPDREIALVYPVTTEIPASDEAYAAAITPFYEEAAEHLAAEIEAGRTLAVLCEGDPFFYGSFMHLWRRLAPRFETEVVPGITGMSGCWTRAGVPITWGDDVLTVCPATLDRDALFNKLTTTDAAVIMKLGRHLPKVREVLKDAGLHERAVYVERGTMAGEFHCPLAQKADDDAPYFAMILVPGLGRRL
ncbi:precorrin-2 C(20)-methyltransferase [Microvirga sp. 2MCAF38]|uniref:precorrin-2 C(20)-methyltransferase n=1 Tax=Microvirga sp. 2MCAF38 TaxID=3232989 RepID=UPI003F9478F1